jgi:hypothetical protein
MSVLADLVVVDSVILGTTTFISYVTGLRHRRATAGAFNATVTNGALTYINSWYQYPPFTAKAVMRTER